MKFSRSTQSWTVEHTYENPNYIGDQNPEEDVVSTISGGSKPPDYSKDPTSLMESPAEKKKRKRSHWVAYSTMFVMTVGFSVVLSGVWPYLEVLDGTLTKQSLGWVVAANPLGQMIASPLVGYIGNRIGSIRVVCYFTMTFFIIGNLLYSFLPAFQGLWEHSAFHIMMLSRFIVGVSSANVTLCRSYLAGSTTTKERTTGIAIISAAQSLGFVVGPATQTILSLTIDNEMMKYRSAGWVAALLGLINFVLLTPWIFQEYNIAEKERSILKNKAAANNDIQIPKVDYVALFGVLFGFFMNQFVYVLLETLMEPFLTDQYEWCNDIAVVVVGISFGCAGIWALVMFVTATRLAKRFDERKILLLGAFLPICIGVFLFIPWGPDKLKLCPPDTTEVTTITSVTTSINNQLLSALDSANSFKHPVHLLNITQAEVVHSSDKGILDILDFTPIATRGFNVSEWCDMDECYGCPDYQTWCEGYNKLPMTQFFVAYAIVISGYPFGVSMSNAIFSKILGPKPQGFWMGILTASGSFSRVLGPIFVAYLYTNKGTTITFSVIFGGMLIAVAELLILFKRIIPMKTQMNGLKK